MRTRFNLLCVTLAALLAAAGCGGPALESGDLTLSVGKDGQLRFVALRATSPLLEDAATLSTITVGGNPVVFGTSEVNGRMLSDAFGKGSSLVLESTSEIGIVREVSVTSYDRYPSTLVVRAVYTNDSDEDVAVDGWSLCDLRVRAAGYRPQKLQKEELHRAR